MFFIVDLTSIYTSEYSSIFRMETLKDSFLRTPRIRFLPFNHQFLQCYLNKIHSKDCQLISSSDFIEFQWNKQIKRDTNISLTIELTKHFNFIDQKKEDLQKRREKNPRIKIPSNDENNIQSPLSIVDLSSPTVISHFPTMSRIINEEKLHLNLNSDHHLSKKIPLKWNLNAFENPNASIVLLTYKNHKWKNSNHLVKIFPTEDKNIYSITFVDQPTIFQDEKIH